MNTAAQIRPPASCPYPAAEMTTTDFADEARSRTARLLRMAATTDPRVRERIVEYATTTPDPPPIGPHGIQTRGCGRCRRTMWAQRDYWVCAWCGHLEDS